MAASFRVSGSGLAGDRIAWTRQELPRTSERKRLFKVLDQVLRGLNAHRQTDQPVGDADGQALLARHGAMAGRSRVDDERASIAEAGRPGKDFHAVHHLLPSLVAALHLETDHGSEGFHLF